jgi:hypothetical protein
MWYRIGTGLRPTKFAPALGEQSHLEIAWVVSAVRLGETINSEEFVLVWAHEKNGVCFASFVVVVVVENLSSENVVNGRFDNIVANDSYMMARYMPSPERVVVVVVVEQEVHTKFEIYTGCSIDTHVCFGYNHALLFLKTEYTSCFRGERYLFAKEEEVYPGLCHSTIELYVEFQYVLRYSSRPKSHLTFLESI